MEPSAQGRARQLCAQSTVKCSFISWIKGASIHGSLLIPCPASINTNETEQSRAERGTRQPKWRIAKKVEQLWEVGEKSSSNLQQGQIEHSATIAMSLSPYLSLSLSRPCALTATFMGRQKIKPSPGPARAQHVAYLIQQQTPEGTAATQNTGKLSQRFP